MSKTYQNIQEEPVMSAEPVAAYGVHRSTAMHNKKANSTQERVMASTISVDEYFDELINRVRKDYADL